MHPDRAGAARTHLHQRLDCQQEEEDDEEDGEEPVGEQVVQQDPNRDAHLRGVRESGRVKTKERTWWGREEGMVYFSQRSWTGAGGGL